LGESHVELPIAYDGEDIGITLDPRYLSDFLKVLSPEQTFAVELRNAESAALCTTEDGYAYENGAVRTLGADDNLHAEEVLIVVER